MKINFVKHQWKEATRSTIFHKNVVVNLIMGFFILIIGLELLIGGIVIGKKFHEIVNEDPVAVFNGILLYYFTASFILRFFLQQVPSFSIQPFLHLPVKKSSLFHYLVSRSLLSIFNFLPLFFFIPMAIYQVSYYYGTTTALVWITGLFLLDLANSMLVVLLKRMLSGNARVPLVAGLLLIALILTDYFGVVSLSNISTAIFGLLIEYNVLLSIPLLLFLTLYLINFRYLKNNAYLEQFSRRRTVVLHGTNRLKYLDSLGETGKLISLELKMMWRNKRSRSLIYMLPIFLLYGFFFYPMPEYHSQYGFLMFIGVFITGGLIMSYGNYFFGWESRHFDLLLASGLDMLTYFRAKYRLMIMFCLFSYVITIPYVFFGRHIFLINTAAFIFNIGINSMVILFFATHNKKRMETTKSAVFNYQGVGASNFLIMIPLFLFPVLVIQPFLWFANIYAGLIFVSLMGFTGLIFHGFLLRSIYRHFQSRKYIMSEGFRKT